MEATLHFGVDVMLEGRDGHWSAVAESLGLVVHGDSEDEVRTRVRHALNELMAVFGNDIAEVRRYLDHHHVESTLIVQPEESLYRQQYRERWYHEVPGGVLA